MHKARLITALGSALVLSACGFLPGDWGAAPKLNNFSADQRGPDEFSVLPVKPLAVPPSVTYLPAPEPNGSNRADLTPLPEAVIALGGNPNATATKDPALVAYAQRLGDSSNIRPVLRAEDLQWRKTHRGRFLERLFNVGVYQRAYADMALNPYDELERWKGTNVHIPNAPPRPEVSTDKNQLVFSANKRN